jgi:hypothetical protein
MSLNCGNIRDCIPPFVTHLKFGINSEYKKISTIYELLVPLISSKQYGVIKWNLYNTCTIFHMEENKFVYDVDNCIEGEIKEDSDYSCCICMCLFNNPMLLPCGHTICLKCINSIKTETCPLCRENFQRNELVQNESIIKLINELTIKCINCNSIHKLGYNCKLTHFVSCNKCNSNKMSLFEFASHYISCCLTKCMFCKKYVTKSGIVEHVITCAFSLNKDYSFKITDDDIKQLNLSKLNLSKLNLYCGITDDDIKQLNLSKFK